MIQQHRKNRHRGRCAALNRHRQNADGKRDPAKGYSDSGIFQPPGPFRRLAR
jgi:hypothetical protein